MLDPHGHVATCNSTHFFIVRDGEFGRHPVIIVSMASRDAMSSMSASEQNFVYEKNFDAGLWRRRGVCHGYLAGLTPVFEVDGQT